MYQRLVYSAVFYCYSYGDHRDLHSFPTRRSSDLRTRAMIWAASSSASGETASVVALSFPPPQPGRRSSSSGRAVPTTRRDRKSTRLNSSHMSISYAVFCLKKKTNIMQLNVSTEDS